MLTYTAHVMLAEFVMPSLDEADGSASTCEEAQQAVLTRSRDDTHARTAAALDGRMMIAAAQHRTAQCNFDQE
jgi:hypothetical protein